MGNGANIRTRGIREKRPERPDNLVSNAALRYSEVPHSSSLQAAQFSHPVSLVMIFFKGKYIYRRQVLSPTTVIQKCF
jgi:hypothetical protein